MFHFLYYSIHRLTYLCQLFSIVVVLILLLEACLRQNDCCDGRRLPHPFSTCRSCHGHPPAYPILDRPPPTLSKRNRGASDGGKGTGERRQCLHQPRRYRHGRRRLRPSLDPTAVVQQGIGTGRTSHPWEQRGSLSESRGWY